MNEPRKWLDGGSAVSVEVARLTQAGRAPRPMSRRELARSVDEIEQLEARAMIPLRNPFGLRRGGLAIAVALLLIGALAAASIPSLLSLSSGANSVTQPSAPEQPALRPLSSLPAPILPEGPPTPGDHDASSASAADSPVVVAKPSHETESAGLAPPSSAIKSREAPLSPATPSANDEATASTEQARFEEEAQLLDRARAVRGSNPERALELLTEHAQRFPKGKLVLDRELLTIDALRSAGRTAEARAMARALLERAKGKPHEEKMRKLLESLP